MLDIFTHVYCTMYMYISITTTEYSKITYNFFLYCDGVMNFNK